MRPLKIRPGRMSSTTSTGSPAFMFSSVFSRIPRVDPYLADVDIGHGRLADAHERSHTQLQIRDDATRWRISGRARQIELCAAQSRRRIADLGIRSSRGAEALARLLEFGFRRDSAASAVSRAAFAWSRRSELSE